MQARRRLSALLAGVMLAPAVLSAQTTRPAGPQLTPRQRLVRQLPAISFNRTPLMRVLDRYGKLSGVKINADWAALEAAGITKETPVTLKARPMSLAKLMPFTLNSIAQKGRPLGWYLSGDEVIVSTQMRVLLRQRVSMLAMGGQTVSSPRTATPTSEAPEFNFKETPLNMVIEFFRELSGANFHVNWRALEAGGIAKETPVTLNVRGISIARALDLVLDQLNAGRDKYGSVYWVIDEGIVHISTGDLLDRHTKVRIYDIGDILFVVPNYKPEDTGFGNTGSNLGSNAGSSNTGLWGGNNTSGNSDSNETSVSEQREQIRQTLIDIIKRAIGEDMWSPTGKGSIQILRNQLIISQTQLGFKLLDKAFRR